MHKSCIPGLSSEGYLLCQFLMPLSTASQGRCLLGDCFFIDAFLVWFSRPFPHSFIAPRALSERHGARQGCIFLPESIPRLYSRYYAIAPRLQVCKVLPPRLRVDDASSATAPEGPKVDRMLCRLSCKALTRGCPEGLPESHAPLHGNIPNSVVLEQHPSRDFPCATAGAPLSQPASRPHQREGAATDAPAVAACTQAAQAPEEPCPRP